MSLTVTSAHGYEATITGWASGITKAWAFAWFKTSDGSAHRGLVQLTENLFDGTQDYLGLTLDGSINVVAGASTSNVDQTTPDPGDFYLWQAAQQNKWTVGCAVFDTAGTTADLKCIFGRAAATAKPATTTTAAVDMGATSAALTRIRVLADRRKVINGSTTDDSFMSTIKAAYIAVGQGDIPSQSQIQSCIDGMHPADLPGVWEYWDLTSSSAGLVGALRGITLAPFGGSATTTWDGADNPTVSPPSSGPTGPTINTQPSNASVTAPATASFTVSATASAGSLTYQWQVSTNSGSSWANVSDGTGATSASYTTSATAVSTGNHRNGYQYRCAVTDSNGTVNSNAATLTVAAAALSVTLDALVDESGNPRAAYLVDKIWAIRVSDNTLVATWTAQTTNGSGVLPALSNGALTAVPHEFVTYTATGLRSGAKVYTPA